MDSNVMVPHVELLEQLKTAETSSVLQSTVKAIEKRVEFCMSSYTFKSTFYTIAADCYTQLWNKEHS